MAVADAAVNRAGKVVLHLVPALFGASGVVGGAERYAFELARHMADEVPTRLVTFGEHASETREGALGVRVLGRGWRVRGQRTNPLSPQLVPEILRAGIVHCHQQHVLMSSLAALLCRSSGRKVFATDLGGGGWDVSAYVSTDSWFHGHLHISEYSRAVAGHQGRRNARVILGGVDTEKFSPDSSVPRSDDPLFVGRVLPHKGVADLIAALPSGMNLDIIGPAGDAAYMERLNREARGKAVRFRHECDDRMLVESYRRASCVVLPSVYRAPDGTETRVPELLGQTLLEAMACETPVICTRVASLPEIVEDGVNGLIVEAGDRDGLRERLRWMAANRHRAAELGAAGRRTVLERFQWRQVVRRCLDAYEAA